MARIGSVLDLIGHTPVVDISELSPSSNAKIWLKLEGRNPGGSIKDRVALAMIEAAERDGLLIQGKPDQVLLEPSSGNTGVALAMICKLRGYHLKVVLPESVTPERRQLLALWGAEIISSPAGEGSNGAVRVARRLAVDHPEWVFLYQYGNAANPDAHYRTTGPEILADVPEITHFIAGLGTSGTLVGVGRYLKEHKPDVQLWAIEPPAGETVDGLRSLEDGFVPPIFTDNDGAQLLDRRVVIRPRDAIEWTRRLTELGLFVGLSTGAIVAGAARCAQTVGEDEDAAIVVASPDDGWKYLSTGAWTGDLDEAAERAQRLTYF